MDERKQEKAVLKLSKELREKLERANGDAEFRRILADNGVDPKTFERSLTDEELEQASGGFKNADGHKVKCPWCGEDREDQISYQFWATLGSSTIKYRCRSCNKYMRMYGSLCCRAEADD